MMGCEFQRLVRVGRMVVCTALLAGCTQIHNDPINQQLTANPAKVEAAVAPEVQTNPDDMVVALAFSGGGMRAAAFSYGVLTGFDETPVRMSTGMRPLLDHIDFISGVSGSATSFVRVNAQSTSAGFK